MNTDPVICGYGAPSMNGALVGLALATAAYLALAGRERWSARGRGWSGGRIAAWLVGAGVVAAGWWPGVLPFAAGDFRQHMLAHLAVGMLGPIGLVMAAPMTLVLRTVPARWGRRVTALLRCRAVRLATHPVMALALNVGGMAAIYFTPLHGLMLAYPWMYYAVHIHFFIAGCLYSWSIAGPDPAPHRPGVPARLIVLGAAVVTHSVLAQLMYAGVGVAVPIAPMERQGGAELMYYGGDLSEMLLAFALVSSWRPASRRLRSEAGTSSPRLAASSVGVVISAVAEIGRGRCRRRVRGDPTSSSRGLP